MNAFTPVDVLPERPYPGLRAFQKGEWPIFFGREQHADEAISRLGRQGLVLVHGASGCGKSSLVRAGVLPTLETHHEAQGKPWQTATMRPSEGPLTRLGEVLEKALPPPADASAGWADLVVQGSGLVDRIEETLRSSGGSFCLLIDQFEEIFRWSRERSDAEARLFIEFLQQAGNRKDGGAFYVILTMRSDYLGECARYDGFAEFLNPRQYLLPRMDEFGLLRAIHEPAELYGGSIDTAVAASLLPVVKRQLDGLPVLQHAMMRASHHARARVAPGAPWLVTAEDLALAGGAEHALAQHADEVLAEATGGDPELLEAAEWIFRALTDLDADRRAIRRPCRLGELVAVSGIDRARTLALIDAFRAPDCSFICPYQPAPIDDGDELDISHEALIRQWPRMCDTGIDPTTGRPNGWVYREFFSGLVWQSLVVQAMAYAENPDHLLSVATTEQRLPWFRRIEVRPGWTRRHALSERGDAASSAEEWRNVKAMMDASGRNLAQQQGMIGRLRRVRNGSLLFLVLALGAFVVSFGLYLRLANTERELAKQIRQTQQLNALFRTFGASLLCGENITRACYAEVDTIVRDQFEFHRDGGGNAQQAISPVAPSPQPEPASAAPAPAGGQQ